MRLSLQCPHCGQPIAVDVEAVLEHDTVQDGSDTIRSTMRLVAVKQHTGAPVVMADTRLEKRILAHREAMG